MHAVQMGSNQKIKPFVWMHLQGEKKWQFHLSFHCDEDGGDLMVCPLTALTLSQGSSETPKVQGQQELLCLNFYSQPEIWKRHVNPQAREAQAVLTHAEEQLGLCSLFLLLGGVNCHDFTKKLIVSGAFPNSWHSWSCMHVFHVSLKA